MKWREEAKKWRADQLKMGFDVKIVQGDIANFKSAEKMFKEITINQRPKPVDRYRSNFKCQKLCHYYKTTWPGTDKTMCHHVEEQLHTIGMTKTVAECSRPGFVIGTYKDPGAVE